MPAGNTPPTPNRRKWARLPATGEEVVLSAPGYPPVRCQVVTQSLGGVELLVPHSVEIHREVDVRRDGSDWRGLTRWTHADTDHYRVGIRWLNSMPSTRPDPSEVATYLAVERLLVRCRSQESPADTAPQQADVQQTDVQLPDGSKWKVPTSTLVHRTINERRAMLEEFDEELDTLIGVYGLAPPLRQRERVDAILEYEFQPDTP